MEITKQMEALTPQEIKFIVTTLTGYIESEERYLESHEKATKFIETMKEMASKEFGMTAEDLGVKDINERQEVLDKIREQLVIVKPILKKFKKLQEIIE